ncbi:hypothetical protein CFH99_21125 [Nocardioides aromaticivorans]|uniref:Uncharacterized protein n=1 Tax=Nocardioides aromaticivorans TaxID=200618 RepID=A0ABX7PR13_9ACTN|nr:hypothetical protein [Nocardioides aromaticivorans]QSR28127.1 hypothetical protein CFH99_21125 [Nocardioides aromaticivorans]
MSEERIAEFRERARDAVGLPDLDGLVRRGVVLRRRRRGAAAAALAAAAVVGFAVLQGPIGDRRSDAPIVDHTTDVPVRAGTVLTDEETLAPGAPAYDHFWLSSGAGVRIQLETPTPGWFVHLGDPQRGLNVGPESAWTGLLWYEATGVRRDQCADEQSAATRVVPLADSLGPLLAMPYTRRVVRAPEQVTLGGRPAEHAVLVLAACGEEDHTSPLATGRASGPLPGGRPFDIWLVPLPEADTALVVFDPTGDGSAEVRRQWRQVVDSLEITVEPAG